MTYQEASDFFDLLIDKANASPFDADQVERFFTLAINEAATDWFELAEKSEEYRNLLSGILRTYTIPPSTSVVNTTAVGASVSGEYWQTVGMSMTFTVTYGSGTTSITRAVTLCKPEELFSRRQDTLRKDTPYAPFYVESTTGSGLVLSVYSGGVANTDGSLLFYKIPNSANSGAPSDPLTDLDASTHQRIVYRAARMALESVGDPRYNTFINEYKLNQ